MKVTKKNIFKNSFLQQNSIWKLLATIIKPNASAEEALDLIEKESY